MKGGDTVKASHRHQVHVQLTGNEAGILFDTLEFLCGGSRYESLADEERSAIDRFRDIIIEGEDNVETEV